MLDRETLLVIGTLIPGVLGLVTMGVGGSLRQRDHALWLWGLGMLIASGNQLFLLVAPSGPTTIAVANASFLVWVVVIVVAVGHASGRAPRWTPMVLWALAAWLPFVACLWLDELRLGRLLNWPHIIGMLLVGLRWALLDKRKRMPLARALLFGGLGLLALAVAFRLTLVAFGDQRALLLMENRTLANMVYLVAALFGLMLGTLGMLLTAMDGVNRRLRFALDMDGLTRLSSRRAFFEQVKRLVPGERRALLMIDADRFKSINDRFGHLGGDAVLRHLGAIFKAHAPAGTLAARFGGEEFALLLPANETSDASRHAEALRAAVEAHPCRRDGEPDIPVTVSIGIALGDQGIDPLLRDADAALYRAKDSGRNRCSGP